jgi:hypothetical protein
MRHLLSTLILLFSAQVLSAAEPRSPAAPAPMIEVLLPAPLHDMHFWVRKLASGRGEIPGMPGLSAAVEALRELDAQLGHPSLPLSPSWGAVDLLVFQAATPAELSKAVAALPEMLPQPMGPPLPRAGITRLAESYLVLEKPFLDQVWPWHQKMIAHAAETVRNDLLPAAAEVFGDVHRYLGSPLPVQPIPLHLVAEAPYPGGVTYVARPGSGLCLVGADAAAGSQWLETVVHESIHALDLGGESALDELRRRLGTLEPRLPAREAWDVSHALMFVQAAGTVRRVLASHHQDYGEASGVYSRLPKASEVVVPAWQAWMRGEITQDAALDRIVDGFRAAPAAEKEKGGPKAAPVPAQAGR